jgi:erythromycin esterase-like protein
VFNFIVVVKNNQSLLDLVEWLHSNKHRYRKFECSTLQGLVVVIVHGGDYEALKQSSQKGMVVVIPKQNGGETK